MAFSLTPVLVKTLLLLLVAIPIKAHTATLITTVPILIFLQAQQLQVITSTASGLSLSLIQVTLALHGGEDGLVFYRAFLAAFPRALKTGGAFLFEIGADEGDALRALGRTAGFSVRILPDLAGRDRMALLTAAD